MGDYDWIRTEREETNRRYRGMRDCDKGYQRSYGWRTRKGQEVSAVLFVSLGERFLTRLRFVATSPLTSEVLLSYFATLSLLGQ